MLELSEAEIECNRRQMGGYKPCLFSRCLESRYYKLHAGVTGAKADRLLPSLELTMDIDIEHFQWQLPPWTSDILTTLTALWLPVSIYKSY